MEHNISIYKNTVNKVVRKARGRYTEEKCIISVDPVLPMSETQGEKWWHVQYSIYNFINERQYNSFGCYVLLFYRSAGMVMKTGHHFGR